MRFAVCPAAVYDLLYCDYYRSTEVTMTGSDWKFTIVQKIVTHPASTRVFAPALFKILDTFYRQGRFYAKPESKVLVEEKFM